MPFAFIPTDRPVTEARPSGRRSRCARCPSGPTCAITFPKLDGYRVELPDETARSPTSTTTRGCTSTRTTVATVDRDRRHRRRAATSIDLDDVRERAPQEVAYALAERRARPARVLGYDDGPVHSPGCSRSSWRSPSEWLDECVTFEPGCDVGDAAAIAEPARTRRREGLRARSSATPSSRDAACCCRSSAASTPTAPPTTSRFLTRKVVIDADRRSRPSTTSCSTASRATPGRRPSPYLLEKRPAGARLRQERRASASRSPTSTRARTHEYVPDFLVRLRRRDDDDVERTLIVEVSGTPQVTRLARQAKAETARDQWCAAVNNHGGFGRWGYVEITT